MARVLVVDDEAGVRQLMERFIRGLGHDVAQAACADAALAMLERQPVDVAFLDVNMPGHDGRWLSVEMRKRYPATAIVFATSIGDLDPHTTLACGVLGYLLKPFNGDAVRHALEGALQWCTTPRRRPREDDTDVEGWLDSLNLARTDIRTE